MKKIIAASFTLALFLGTTTASAASYNCRYTKLAAEVEICQDGRLSRLDEQMAAKYFRLKNRLPRHLWRQVRYTQKGWLRSRNRCGYNFRCLENSYYSRIQGLNSWLRSY